MCDCIAQIQHYKVYCDVILHHYMQSDVIITFHDVILGRLGILDYDDIEISNLHRQV